MKKFWNPFERCYMRRGDVISCFPFRSTRKHTYHIPQFPHNPARQAELREYERVSSYGLRLDLNRKNYWDSLATGCPPALASVQVVVLIQKSIT